MKCFSSLIFTALFVGFSSHSFAQILPREDEQKDAGLEDLYDKFEDDENQQTAKRKSTDKKHEAEQSKEQEKEYTKLSELVGLAPFEDIAVIERRFLPKTKRFEASGSFLTSTNNQYFNNLGLGARLGFFFQEKYGIEATYMFISSSERPITNGLLDNQNVKTKSLVQPEGFYGAAFKWSPVYGKVAWFQQKIIPFDLYFTPGFGMTQTASGGSAATMALGIGQLFALSKSYGVRWDFNWHYYQTEVTVDGAKESQNHSDLLLGVGLSFFFPEATYR